MITYIASHVRNKNYKFILLPFLCLLLFSCYTGEENIDNAKLIEGNTLSGEDWEIKLLHAKESKECAYRESDGILIKVLLTRYDDVGRFPSGLNLFTNKDKHVGRLSLESPDVIKGQSDIFKICFSATRGSLYNDDILLGIEDKRMRVHVETNASIHNGQA